VASARRFIVSTACRKKSVEARDRVKGLIRSAAMWDRANFDGERSMFQIPNVILIDFAKRLDQTNAGPIMKDGPCTAT
jgi:hypothetical protein